MIIGIWWHCHFCFYRPRAVSKRNPYRPTTALQLSQQCSVFFSVEGRKIKIPHFAWSSWTHSKACLQFFSPKKSRTRPVCVEHWVARKLISTPKPNILNDETYLTHFYVRESKYPRRFWDIDLQLSEYVLHADPEAWPARFFSSTFFFRGTKLG